MDVVRSAWVPLCGLWLLGCVGAAAQVTAISTTAHPNLYFNAAEIAQLRQAIVVERSLPYAAAAYEAIRSVAPAGKPVGFDTLSYPESFHAARQCTIDNLKACWGYLLEPSAPKAAALKTALLSWTAARGVYWMTSAQHAAYIHTALTWMYDLLYNSGQLNAAEKTALDAWFAECAGGLVRDNAYWAAYSTNLVNKEGSVRVGYDNWRQFDHHTGVLCALVSHNQALVNRACQSGFPEDLFVSTGVAAYAPATRDWKNMVNGLVFPSGYNFNGYKSNYGFNAPDEPYDGVPDGAGQSDHFYVLIVPVLSAEAVTHNGFDGWRYAARALLRTFEVAAPFAAVAGPSRHNWAPLYWFAYRRSPNNLVLRSQVFSTAGRGSVPYLFDNTCPLWGALGDIAAPEPVQPEQVLIFNYPNPFIPGHGTVIQYTLTHSADTTVQIFDLLGRLVFRKDIPSGSYGGVEGINTIPWDGRSMHGTFVESGGYICVVDSAGKRLKTKVAVR